jgi:hypothetical protein
MAGRAHHFAEDHLADLLEVAVGRVAQIFVGYLEEVEHTSQA